MKKRFKLQPMLLLAIAAVLLLGSAVGSTQGITNHVFLPHIQIAHNGAVKVTARYTGFRL